MSGEEEGEQREEHGERAGCAREHGERAGSRARACRAEKTLQWPS